MESTGKITINFEQEGFEQCISVTQYDTGKKVRCNIAGISGNIGAAMVYCKKPSGLETYTDADIVDDHTVEFYITEQMNAEVGDVKSQLQLFGEDKSLTSYKFKIKVTENMIASSKVTSADDYPAFRNALEKFTGMTAEFRNELEGEKSERQAADEVEKSERQAADAAEKAERMQEIAVERARINNLVASNNPTEGNSELQDIRVGYDGTRYENAGEAVREQIGLLSEDIDNKIAAKFIINEIVTPDGRFSSNSEWKRTDYIDVTPLSGFYAYIAENSYVSSISFFDMNKEFISGVTVNGTMREYRYDEIDFPENAAYVIFCSYFSDKNPNYKDPNVILRQKIGHKIDVLKEDIGHEIDVLKEENNILMKTYIDFSKLKYMCFGDSVMSDDIINSTGITGNGSLICEMLGCEKIENFAHGNATCSDYYSGSINETIDTPDVDYSGDPSKPQANEKNVLSNQVKRALAKATNTGSNVTYKHPIDGEITLDTSIWTGTGNAENVPNIIYIAIGINDGNEKNIVVDDTEKVFSQEYSELDRCGFASSLRWAIETLISKFPDVQIFVASPLQTGGAYERINYKNTKLKRDIIEKVCRFCSAHFIDSFSDSGFNRMLAKGDIASWGSDGIHPKQAWRENIARYVANEIRNRYTERNH